MPRSMLTPRRADIDIPFEPRGRHALHAGLEQDAALLRIDADLVRGGVAEIVKRQVVRIPHAAHVERDRLVDQAERRERFAPAAAGLTPDKNG